MNLIIKWYLLFRIKQRAYYTYNGISRYLDVENDSHDIWYKDYLDSGKRYTVNVDTDEDNNWSLSVFINYGILTRMETFWEYVVSELI